MATSTVISNARTGHRTARIAINGYPGALALDWANGLATTLSSTASISTGVIDASNDRIVLCATTSTTVFITVGVSPTASSAGPAGSMPLPAAIPWTPIYVPAGAAIAGAAGAAATLWTIPALIASDPG